MAEEPKRSYQIRKSDYLASLSLASLIGLSGFTWKIRSDIEQLIESSANTTSGRVSLQLSELRSEVQQSSNESIRITRDLEQRCEKSDLEIKSELRDLRNQVIQLMYRGRQ